MSGLLTVGPHVYMDTFLISMERKTSLARDFELNNIISGVSPPFSAEYSTWFVTMACFEGAALVLAMALKEFADHAWVVLLPKA
jgi:hypothetical protein